MCPVIGCGNFCSSWMLLSPAPAVFPADAVGRSSWGSRFLSLQVLRNRGVYENVKYVQQENFWIGPSSVSAVVCDCCGLMGGCSHATSPSRGLRCLELGGSSCCWLEFSMGPCHHWQGAAELPAPATLQNGLPGGWDGPWHSCFAPCSYKAKHGARENAGFTWCVTALLMPFPLGKAVVSESFLATALDFLGPWARKSLNFVLGLPS